MYSVQLQRGTPEFLDGLVGAQGSSEQLRSHRSGDSSTYRSGAPDLDRMYRSNSSSVAYSESAQQAGEGRASLQEENDWLRSALRLAEAHIKKDKEELKSLHAIFERNQHDNERRVKSLQDQVAQRDAERRELEERAWHADEKARAAGAKKSVAIPGVARRQLPAAREQGHAPRGEEKCCGPRSCPQPGRNATPPARRAWTSVVTRQCSCPTDSCPSDNYTDA